jgi:hypothetical protein
VDDLVNIQKAIFQQIKGSLAPNLSLVHEIAQVLEISYDSSYRRIRGDKVLSFEEVYKLCRNYRISVDSYCGIASNKVVFDCRIVEPESFCVIDWLRFVLHNVEIFRAATEREIIYSAKDPPIFHYFQFPEISAFKVFFWEKTLYKFPNHKESLFCLDDMNPEIQKVGRQILSLSTKIPTIEIWNQDTFDITLSQIEYYWESGLFAKKDDFLNILDKLEQWIYHIQKQAEYGCKFIYGEPAEGLEDSFQLYENELVLGDNTIFVKLDGVSNVFKAFNSLNLLHTTNPAFCNSVEVYLRGLISSSNLISQVGEKERHKFFNRLLCSVKTFRERYA